ncbi:MAG: ABC transporter ATP-binding protein [Eubacteriales bacterium]|nr:ABC transporter ATP-binding protein [Eubacteriales bacterium]
MENRKSIKNYSSTKKQIRIKDLNQYYGKKQVLCGINLTIGEGMFGLLGRNGAGKTTLMKTMAGLLPKKEGTLEICGIPVENVREIRRIIGYLPQDFSMYPGMQVREVMDYLGILSGMQRKERRKRTRELLEKVNLAHASGQKVRTLSGGMKRRLGIAQALLHDPKVLIVDEPTAGLDPEERIRFRNLLCDIAKDRIVILSTHIVADIEASCEQIAILNGGRLLFHDTVASLMECAEGKVYELETDRKGAEQMKEHFPITGTRTQGTGICVRFLSENPVKGARACMPNMEDAYMLCLHREEIRGGE